MTGLLWHKSLYLSIGLCAYFLLALPVAHAQFDAGFSTLLTPTIQFEPAFPGANTSVTVRIDSQALGLTGAEIRWFVDGTENLDARSQTSFEILSGAIGEETRIQVTVSGQSGDFRVERVLASRDIDIVVEADTITPAFYKGRALPSAGSSVTVIAIPYLGIDLDPQELYYTWRVDNQTFFGGAIKGQQRMEFELENGRKRTVSVEVSSSVGEILARKLLAIDDTKTLLRFYEDNPLRGTIQVALRDRFTMNNVEVGIRAVPYFMSVEVREEDVAQHVWSVNGRSIENPSGDPFFIALRKTGSGDATLSFSVRNLRDLLQNALGQITIAFE